MSSWRTRGFSKHAEGACGRRVRVDDGEAIWFPGGGLACRSRLEPDACEFLCGIERILGVRRIILEAGLTLQSEGEGTLGRIGDRR